MHSSVAQKSWGQKVAIFRRTAAISDSRIVIKKCHCLSYGIRRKITRNLLAHIVLVCLRKEIKMLSDTIRSNFVLLSSAEKIVRQAKNGRRATAPPSTPCDDATVDGLDTAAEHPDDTCYHGNR